MANFVKHEGCPSCGSKDNLGRYDDGSAWCFGCGHYERATKFRIPANGPKRPPERFYELVDTLPPANKNWLLQYGLTEEEIKRFFKYNPRTDRHVYEVRNRDGSIAYYEERAVDGRTPKTMSHGSKVIEVLGDMGESNRVATVVLCEDIVSSIKVSRQIPTIAIHGAKIPTDWWPYLQGITSCLVFWLDYDKYGEAVKQASQARLRGFTSHVIRTKEDPKELSDEQITKVLDSLS